MELNRVMKREREVSSVGPGTDDENPEPIDRGKSTGEVGRLGRQKPVEDRHLPGVLDWDKEVDLGSYLRERGALDLMTRSNLRDPDIYVLQRMAARCALEEMNEQLKFSEDRSTAKTKLSPIKMGSSEVLRPSCTMWALSSPKMGKTVMGSVG
jgi:hypothetical protein